LEDVSEAKQQAKKKAIRAKFNLKDLSRKKNMGNLKLKSRRRRQNVRARSLVPSDLNMNLVRKAAKF